MTEDEWRRSHLYRTRIEWRTKIGDETKYGAMSDTNETQTRNDTILRLGRANRPRIKLYIMCEKETSER